MKNLFKKTLCLALTLGMLASMISIGALASDNSDIVFSEDFEDVTAIDGMDINGWNGWSNTSTSNSGGTLDASYKILQESGNKVGHLTRTNCDTASSKGYNSEKAITNETGRYLSWKFRVRFDNSNTKSITLTLSDGSKKVALIQYFDNKRLFLGDSNTYLSDKFITGMWYNYEIYFDMQEHLMSLFLNDTKIEALENISHSLTGLSLIKVESDRVSGATVPTGHDGKSVIADIKIDDILIENITESAYNEALYGPVIDEPVVDEDIIISEDFESGTVGNDIVGWNNWENMQTSAANDSYFKIQKESATNNNLVGNLTRTYTPNSQDNSKQFLPTKKAAEGLKTGDYACLKFRVLTANTNAKALTLDAYQSTGYTSSDRVRIVTLYLNDDVNLLG